ncbi:MAG: TlpA family protein disulfide reductase [Bacteroidales bacterium]|nr:TlpA family protein disulfide reductase [Bacteroidales bacterium]
MRISVAIVCLLFVGGWGLLEAQSATIRGTDPDYSGASIHVSIPGNPFMTVLKYSETITCGDNGNFEIAVDVETGTMVQLETGIYQATLYVEPDCSYEVVLPAYRKKEYADRISPFYQPLRVPLRVVNRSGDVNLDIYRFDSLFFRVNEEVILSRRLGKETDMDSMIHWLESAFEGDTSLFFNKYQRYKYGVLKLNQGKTGLEAISKKYLGPVVSESHPGFMELFNAMFKDFLFYYSRTPDGNGLRNHINRTHHLDSVRNIIGRHPSVWNDTLVDMILLQELSVAFYRGDFHKEAILILLDSMVMDPVNPAFAVYAKQIKKKLSSLVVGHPPPRFTLSDPDGNHYTPDDFAGKYIYLIFCTPDHYGCMMEYPFLQSYHLKHSAYLEVVTVMVTEEKDLVGAFMRRNGYGWKALYYDDQPGILEDYLVKAFPMAYLIGPDGNLVLSPSSLPTDGFEQQLFRIMRSRGEI